MQDIRRTTKMSIKEILAELNNIKEQATNEVDIGKESILEALTDINTTSISYT